MSRGVLAAFAFLAAAILQQAVAFRWAVLGAHPDFLLVALTLFASRSSRSSGMVLGFSDGVVMGALAGANMQHYVFSRTIVGLLLSWIGSIQQLQTPVVIGVFAAASTIVAQVILMFSAAPHGIGGFLADTLRTAVYNGVLAISVFALLKRVMTPVAR